MVTHRIAVLGGDGIGPEVVDQGLRVLDELEHGSDLVTERTYYDLGGRRYLDTGELLSDATLEELRAANAIYLGAVGTPDVPPGIIEHGLLLRLRSEFDQFVNLRPVKLYAGVRSPITDLSPDNCNFIVVRENTESLYASVGGVLHRGSASEVATEESVNTRRGVERIIRYAFGLARSRERRRLTLCHKVNVLVHAGDLWWRTFNEVGEDYPDVSRDYVHVDAAAMYLVTQPERFDVVVTENMFGDILTDLGAAVQGGMGLAASANLDPTRVNPSMFEPVHGSAPDIAGQGRANPTAAIIALGMMLEHLGEVSAARKVERALGEWFAAHGEEGIGRYTTDEVGRRVAQLVRSG